MEATIDIPPALYAVVGVLILTNLGAIGTLIVFIFKVGMFVAETKAGIADSKERANRAHTRLTSHEEKFHGKTL